jgi:hypothetical protein
MFVFLFSRFKIKNDCIFFCWKNIAPGPINISMQPCRQTKFRPAARVPRPPVHCSSWPKPTGEAELGLWSQSASHRSPAVFTSHCTQGRKGGSRRAQTSLSSLAGLVAGGSISIFDYRHDEDTIGPGNWSPLPIRQ